MELSFNMDEFIADFEKSCIRVQKRVYKKMKLLLVTYKKEISFVF